MTFEMPFPLRQLDRPGLDQLYDDLRVWWEKNRLPAVEPVTTLAALNSLLAVLPERERVIVASYYGLAGRLFLTYDTILADREISRERGRQIRLKVLKKLYEELVKQAARQQWAIARTRRERLAVPIEVLDVDKRVIDALRHNHLNTLGDILAEGDVSWVGGIGPLRTKELDAAIKKLRPRLR